MITCGGPKEGNADLILEAFTPMANTPKAVLFKNWSNDES